MLLNADGDHEGHLSEKVHRDLHRLTQAVDHTALLTGYRAPSILVTPFFAQVLEAEGLIPLFDHDLTERCWVWWWCTFRGIRIVSRCMCEEPRPRG